MVRCASEVIRRVRSGASDSIAAFLPGLALVLQRHRHCGRAGVLGDVGQGLLHEPVDDRFQLGVEALDPLQVGLDELDRRSGPVISPSCWAASRRGRAPG